MGKIKITWKRSSIGYADNQKRTIKALGLKRLNHHVEHDASPSVLGMVQKVKHLVDIEKVS